MIYSFNYKLLIITYNIVYPFTDSFYKISRLSKLQHLIVGFAGQLVIEIK